MTTDPTAQILAIHFDEETRIVAISCPICEGTHVHGWPYGQIGPVGHRIGHCLHKPATGPQGYYIPDPATVDYRPDTR